MPLKILLSTGLLLGSCASLAQSLQCSALFREAVTPTSRLLSSMELISRGGKSKGLNRNIDGLRKAIEQRLRSLPASSIEISPLADGNFVILAQNIASPKLQKYVANLSRDRSFEDLIKSYFKDSKNHKLRLDLVQEPSTMAPLLIFEGKHAYPEFEKALHRARKEWDQTHSLKDYMVIGREHPFGTQIENAENLIGLNIVGIAVTIKRIISKPLEKASIEEFAGTVTRIENINEGGADPVWKATLQTPQGEKEINLTEAIGLRTRDGSGKSSSPLSGNEEAAARSRRQEAFLKFKRENFNSAKVSFTKDFHTKLMERVQRLPESAQERILGLREDILNSFSRGSVLQREAFDMAPRPLTKLKDENFRPMVEEVQRQLYDTESKAGFKQWLADFALEIYLDIHQTRGLQLSTRQVLIRDVRANYPFSEGLHGMPTEKLEVAHIPRVTEADVIRVIDRRISLYGFDEGLSKVPGIRLAKNAKYLATLDGFSLEDSTVVFVEYSKNNLLFQDTYFVGKPHGQYSHVFQWLYLAERMSQPKQNAFQANMLGPLMRVQPYFVDDFATGVRVTDFVGQRAPQNPDYVNNLVQLIFPLN